MVVERKVEQFRQKLIRINNIKKQLIDCEISWLTIKKALNLSLYDYRKLIVGDLEEREAEVLELINNTPEFIKNRERKAKTVQKIMLEREMTLKEFCQENKLDKNKVYRVLRDLPAERDEVLERKIEKALNVKIF